MIDYKKSFEKLVSQIEFECKWAESSFERSNSEFDKGMTMAYDSIKSLADQLRDGTFNLKEES